MSRILDAGGRLTIVLREPGDWSRFRNQIRAAVKFSLIPDGYQLVHRWLDRHSREVALVPIDEVDRFLESENPRLITVDDPITDDERRAAQAQSDTRRRQETLAARLDTWQRFALLREYAQGLTELLAKCADPPPGAEEWAAWVADRAASEQTVAELLAGPDLPAITDDEVHASRRSVRRRQPQFPMSWSVASDTSN